MLFSRTEVLGVFFEKKNIVSLMCDKIRQSLYHLALNCINVK